MNITTDEAFGDGAYIFYVNSEYRGDDELGKLMHDFNCHDAEDMNYALMADRTRYLKENPKGVTDMCKSMEDMRDKAWNEGKADISLSPEIQKRISASSMEILFHSVKAWHCNYILYS